MHISSNSQKPKKIFFVCLFHATPVWPSFSSASTSPSCALYIGTQQLVGTVYSWQRPVLVTYACWDSGSQMLRSSTTSATTFVGAPVVQWPAEYVSIHIYILYFNDLLKEWEDKDMDKIVSRHTFSHQMNDYVQGCVIQRKTMNLWWYHRNNYQVCYDQNHICSISHIKIFQR